jgi:hypothetical protein
MKATRAILLVLGTFFALIGLGLLVAGATIGLAMATQRDDAGFFTTPTERYETTHYAITTDRVDLGEPGPDDWWADRRLATVRITADNARSGSLFVGIGRERDVERFLAGVPHDEVTDVDFHPFSATYRGDEMTGTRRPADPTAQDFWAAQTSGTTTQTLEWDLQPGRWALVVMNTDGTSGVTADIEAAGQVDFLAWLALGLAGIGLIVLTVGTVMIVSGAGRRGRTDNYEPPIYPPTMYPPTMYAPTMYPRTATGSFAGSGAVANGASPVRLEGHLDEPLSRWMWLVKWILVIPHVLVLILLWIAFTAVTVVAFFAILFTGRYPRRMFDFNVGVLRWSWRVSFYASSAFGTDRYPPFTMEPEQYPATLDIEYPQRLSRGLVLVKSWLLALPHLLIISLLTAGWTFGDRDGLTFFFGGGVLGVLVIVAGLILLFSGRYPRGLFDLVIGLNRWIYRVIAYVALMTDDYPPFHLDQGPTEPWGPPPSPPQSPTVDARERAEV